MGITMKPLKASTAAAATAESQLIDPKWSETLAELLDLFERNTGSPDQAQALVKVLCKEFGGLQVYIPTLRSSTIAIRDKAIFNEYTKGNTHELSRKYNLTEARIYHIVKKQREYITKEMQPDLF